MDKKNAFIFVKMAGKYCKDSEMHKHDEENYLECENVEVGEWKGYIVMWRAVLLQSENQRFKHWEIKAVRNTGALLRRAMTGTTQKKINKTQQAGV